MYKIEDFIIKIVHKNITSLFSQRDSSFILDVNKKILKKEKFSEKQFSYILFILKKYKTKISKELNLDEKILLNAIDEKYTSLEIYTKNAVNEIKYVGGNFICIKFLYNEKIINFIKYMNHVLHEKSKIQSEYLLKFQDNSLFFYDKTQRVWFLKLIPHYDEMKNLLYEMVEKFNFVLDDEVKNIFDRKNIKNISKICVSGENICINNINPYIHDIL